MARLLVVAAAALQLLRLQQSGCRPSLLFGLLGLRSNLLLLPATACITCLPPLCEKAW
jgi:hypothetical protein